MQVKSDFIKDFENHMRFQLQANGFKNIPEDPNLLWSGFCRVLSRKIPAHKRTVEKSAGFFCPGKHRKGLAELENAVLRGDNLLAYQSKNILNVQYEDALFNDWGIHHLHLGAGREKDSLFMTRTRALLYCVVTGAAVYFIGILEHGDKEIEELIAVVHRNWPGLISKYKMGAASTERYNDQQINEIPNAGGTCLLFVEDCVYAPKDASLENAAQADLLRRQIMEFEEHLYKNIKKFSKAIQNIIGAKTDALSFKLEFETHTAYARETSSGLRFKLGDLPVFL